MGKLYKLLCLSKNSIHYKILFCYFVFLQVNVCSVKAQTLSWVSQGSIPTNAVQTGKEEGRSLYVCKASYNGGTHPGKIVANYCNISYGGKELVLANYEILVGTGNWSSPRSGLQGAFVAGYETTGSPLYLCRANYQNGTHPGKVVAGFCNIAWGGQEVVLSNYELLYTNRQSLSSSVAITQNNPTIISAEITFNTTGDDKDWDTEPFADIYIDGRTIALLGCCSSDRKADKWGGGSVTKSLQIKENASKIDILTKGICVLGAQGGPHGQGNDTWKFNASLKINYSNNTSSYHSGTGWNGIEFYSYSRSHESTNPISLSKHQ